MTGLTVWVLADLAVGVAFLGSAGLVWWRGRTRLPAALLGIAGVAWFLGNLAGLPGFLGAAASATTFVHRGPLIHLVLAGPTGRPRSRGITAAVAVGYAASAVPWVARNEVTCLVLAVGLVSIAWRERRWSVDVMPAVLLSAALGGPALARLFLTPTVAGATLLWYDACLLAVAGVLAANLLRPPSAEIADLVVSLSVAPSRSLSDALARTVGDPTLQVALVAVNGFVDAHGAPVDLDDGPGRIVTPLIRKGRTFGYISHDPAVLADPVLVKVVATAAELTSANARLQTDVERQAAEVRASRRRIVTAAMQERRRLEAELQNGAGARLDRVARLLDNLPRDAADPDVLSMARRQVDEARVDMRDLARGLDPLAVRTSGLAGAVSDLATSAPLPVSVEVDLDALPDPVAATAYYVCAEGLANVARHAGARSAAVCIRQRQQSVLVTVYDDGTGGADPRGSGLRGLADRVQALGGELEVRSGPTGTRLSALLPLDS